MKLRRVSAGHYVTPDGRFHITTEVAWTSCDGPHPMPDGTYHEGGEEHTYEFWLVTSSDDDGGGQVADGDTLRECVRWLDGEYAQVPAGVADGTA